MLNITYHPTLLYNNNHYFLALSYNPLYIVVTQQLLLLLHIVSLQYTMYLIFIALYKQPVCPAWLRLRSVIYSDVTYYNLCSVWISYKCSFLLHIHYTIIPLFLDLHITHNLSPFNSKLIQTLFFFPIPNWSSLATSNALPK